MGSAASPDFEFDLSGFSPAVLRRVEADFDAIRARLEAEAAQRDTVDVLAIDPERAIRENGEAVARVFRGTKPILRLTVAVADTHFLLQILPANVRREIERQYTVATHSRDDAGVRRIKPTFPPLLRELLGFDTSLPSLAIAFELEFDPTTIETLNFAIKRVRVNPQIVRQDQAPLQLRDPTSPNWRALAELHDLSKHLGRRLEVSTAQAIQRVVSDAMAAYAHENNLPLIVGRGDALMAARTIDETDRLSLSAPVRSPWDRINLSQIASFHFDGHRLWDVAQLDHEAKAIGTSRRRANEFRRERIANLTGDWWHNERFVDSMWSTLEHQGTLPPQHTIALILHPPPRSERQLRQLREVAIEFVGGRASAAALSAHGRDVGIVDALNETTRIVESPRWGKTWHTRVEIVVNGEPFEGESWGETPRQVIEDAHLVAWEQIGAAALKRNLTGAAFESPRAVEL